ncbi:MAG: hypothetical protein BMS9Abin10_0567 [Gammaproteobacteria bacterium]|nr:MAG: hypothetical protein BMS9Abin10_0567 [Gammaproteobacteria bacterium]
MTEIERYALWLLPAETVAPRCAKLIGRLAERYGTPRFEPHVTLLGWVTGPKQELIARTEHLARGLRALKLLGQSIAGEPYYFRCLYIKLEKSRELLGAHEQASEIFMGGYASDYLPHLSLLYGQLPRAEKARLFAELETELPADLDVDRLRLVRITLSVQDWRPVVSHALQA